MKNRVIYKITNLTNSKIYIGQTNNLKSRWSTHCTDSKKGCLITKDIMLFGKNNFKLEILHENLSVQESNKLERIEIELNDCLFPKGYNLRKGGFAMEHHALSKEKMSYARIGMMMINKTGVLHHNSKDILQFDLNGNYINYFGSSYEAAASTDCQQSHINKSCREEIYTAGGFIWMFREKYSQHEIYRRIYEYKKRHEYCEKKVKNIETKQEFASLKKAADSVGVTLQAMSRCINKLSKTCGGFHWELIQ